MNRSDLISSDDENEAKPAKRKKPTRDNRKPVSYDVLLSSDDSDNEKIVFKRVKQEEKLLGEISLLTSDEEYIPETPFSKKPSQKSKTSRQKPLKTIDIVTSDEEEAITKVSGKRMKRKLNETTCNGNSAAEVPLKRTKTSAGKAPSQKLTKKPATSTAPSSAHTSPEVNSNNVSENITPAWEESQLLAERSQIENEVAKNLIKLWEEGNTIPFIARYRKKAIGDMTPEDLRNTKETYDEICSLKKKMNVVAKAIIQVGKLDSKLQGSVCAARTMEELEYIYAPFKPDSKVSLAERAKRCGLEEPALHLLNNTGMVNPKDYVQTNVNEVKTPEDVEKGIVHIIASEMATNSELLTFLRELRRNTYFKLQTKKARKTKPKENTSKAKTKKVSPQTDEAKFERYFDSNFRVDHLKSHQILAINRGEALKVLSVKVEIPQFFKKQFIDFCNKKWTFKSKYDTKRQTILDLAIEDAYQRLIVPLVTREIRADLKLKAEKESCKIFSQNLKHMLLSRPVKGKAILGIDPGYKNGCKLALISPTGSLLAQNVVYPHTSKDNRGESTVKEMLTKHNCSLVAIGNGTACRQTEEWISSLIKNRYFNPLEVQYTIVNEDGASIYSCSPEARKEFGTLDPNIVSAVSLARRVQDPMAELVKVEPCHLGIGMYQLDLKKKQLEEALNEVVSECVSFVGVDLNTASQCLLRRVAGLSEKRASQIMDYRERNGPFTYRRQLLDVFGIGERIFEQCAGFLRVGPTDPNDENFYKNRRTTPLDATVIHPESYPIVRSLLEKMDLKEKDVGSDQFIRNFKASSQKFDAETLAEAYNTDKQTIQLIFEALSKALNHDLRTEVSKTPLFKTDFKCIEDLKAGTILTGRVKNVTAFGAFVDIGVKNDGLVHNNFKKGLDLCLGDMVEVKVISVDAVKGRIQLEAIRQIN